MGTVWRFKSQAQAVAGGRDKPEPDVAVARDGGLWRGPSEARWITQVPHGAPLPRASAHACADVVPHG